MNNLTEEDKKNLMKIAEKGIMSVHTIFPDTYEDFLIKTGLCDFYDDYVDKFYNPSAEDVYFKEGERALDIINSEMREFVKNKIIESEQSTKLITKEEIPFDELKKAGITEQSLSATDMKNLQMGKETKELSLINSETGLKESGTIKLIKDDKGGINPVFNFVSKPDMKRNIKL